MTPIRKITFKRGEVTFVYKVGQELQNGMAIERFDEVQKGTSYGVEIYVGNGEEYTMWQRVLNCELHIEFDYEELLRS